MLTLLAVAELAGMSLWFTAAAVAPWLKAYWGLTDAQSGWLTTAVQLGFVVGTALAALLNLGDLIPSRRLFAASALLAAVSNALLIVAPGFAVALGLRFLTGMLLAGVYPPAMKMIATWFRDARGLAIGVIVGALTIGKATPYLIRALGVTDPIKVLVVSSSAAAAAALLVGLGYRDGPHAFEARPFSPALVGTILRDRPTRLAIGGYLGHMWELYAMWTWIPVFVAHALTGRDADPAVGDLIAFGAIAVGGLGCVWGGRAADRRGRVWVVNLSMAISGSCCLVAGFMFDANLLLLTALILIWGFFVVADSAQFSALVTEVAPRHAVGTALMLQTSLGFLLTIVTIQAVPSIAAGSGWRWAFPILSIGPFLGIAAMRRLKTS
jgi:MFS family permease